MPFLDQSLVLNVFTENNCTNDNPCVKPNILNIVYFYFFPTLILPYFVINYNLKKNGAIQTIKRQKIYG